MKNLFITKFEKELQKPTRFFEEENKKLYTLFNNDSENNTLYLIQALKKHSINETTKITRYFHHISGFLEYMGKNHNYNNQEIITILKEKLENQVKLEKPEQYQAILNTLFSINKDDKKYYRDQYELLKKEKKLYHDINNTFLDIFIKLKINDKFIEAFEQIIIDNINHCHPYEVRMGFEYLNTLQNPKFKKYFGELLKYFQSPENKWKLVHYHEYTSLVRNKAEIDSDIMFDSDSESKTETKTDNLLEKLFQNIENYKFNQDALLQFLCGDIEYALKNYERSLLDIVFINELSKYLWKKNKNFLLSVLKNISKENVLFQIESYVVEYLHIDDVEEFVSMFQGTENENIIYFVYDRAKQEGKVDLFEAFEKSPTIGNSIHERNKRIEENSQKYEKEVQKRIEKEKEDFFKILHPTTGHDYPKLFQDYVNYLYSEGGFEKIFSSEEQVKVNNAIKEQIITFLDTINIQDYSDKKIETLIVYHKNEDNSCSITEYSIYLSWIIEIVKHLQFDVSKYYKIFVLFFPLLSGDILKKEVFDIIGERLQEDDINYILRVYSEDLHNKAIGLRYFNPDNIVNFYNRFSDKFTEKHKEHLEKICLEMIESQNECGIYCKEGFVKIYALVGGEKKFLKLWEKWEGKYSKFNYFKDVIDRGKGSKSDLDAINFLTFINKIHILHFQDKEAVLWRLNQLRNGIIECTDELAVEYPYTSTGMRHLSSKFSELNFGFSDEYKFSYIFANIPKIDIKTEILELLQYSFEIQSDLISGKLKGDYIMYYRYLRDIFFAYIRRLNTSLVDKNFYYKVKALL